MDSLEKLSQRIAELIRQAERTDAAFKRCNIGEMKRGEIIADLKHLSGYNAMVQEREEILKYGMDTTATE